MNYFNRYRFLRANFPISGYIETPTIDDYAHEASLLRQQARETRPANHDEGHFLARKFERVARRKQWADAMRPRQAADEAA